MILKQTLKNKQLNHPLRYHNIYRCSLFPYDERGEHPQLPSNNPGGSDDNRFTKKQL